MTLNMCHIIKHVNIWSFRLSVCKLQFKRHFWRQHRSKICIPSREKSRAFTTIRGAFCNNSLSYETRQLVQLNKTQLLPSSVTKVIFIIRSLRPQSAFRFRDMGRFGASVLEWEHAFSREILIRMEHLATEDPSTVNKWRFPNTHTHTIRVVKADP